MGFGDLKSASGLQDLDAYLSDKSYVEGYGVHNFILRMAAIYSLVSDTYHPKLIWLSLMPLADLP